ncbi:MAG: putative sulfate exporter family transporter [Deltaproteobacteria bacterium]|nr:putative sulfate exporter family transporter [Deltaproteobacteria bacterium]
MGVTQKPSGDPYSNPELFRFADGMEGVPDFLDLAETEAERSSRGGWRARGHEALQALGELAPGLLLAGALAFAGSGLSRALGQGLLGADSSPISPILIAIMSGLLIRNTIGLPKIFERGLQFCLRRGLRIGVALLGIKLSVSAVGDIGLVALPLVVLCIMSAWVVVRFATRVLSLPGRLGALIAVGTAICGNTAIVAIAPVIGASDDETSYAVGTITLFGLLALILHPFIAHALFGSDPLLSGIFLGTAIHDTAQVAGAGLLYDQQFSSPYTLEAAMVTKLLRNTFIVAVVPIMALLYSGPGLNQSISRTSFLKAMPLFVIGFIAMAIFRTWGDLGPEPFGGFMSPMQWQSLIGGLSELSVVCLAVAMASVGLGTHLARLRVLGLRPLAVGLLASLTVGGVSAVLLMSLGPWLSSLV